MLARPLPLLAARDDLPAALWLLRHGHSEGNASGAEAALAGTPRAAAVGRDADVGLTALGRRQAVSVGRWVASLPPGERPSAVLASPYARARETVAGVLEGWGHELPVATDERLRERDLGAFEGLTGFGVREELPAEAARRDEVGKMWFRPPGGESWADVLLRVRSLLAGDLARWSGERLLVVSHQAVVMCLRVLLEGLDEAEALEADASRPQANGALTRYLREERAGRVAGGAPAAGLRLEAYADAGPAGGDLT